MRAWGQLAASSGSIEVGAANTHGDVGLADGGDGERGANRAGMAGSSTGGTEIGRGMGARTEDAGDCCSTGPAGSTGQG